MLRVINPSDACVDFPTQLATSYSWPLDPFQQHAIAAIHRDENVLVTAKTGSGKTLVGEYQIHYSLAKGKRVFYTTPIKSLSNQKFHDLKEMFPSVGILTGDIKFRPDAQVVVMTTEILRNMLYKRCSTTASLGLSANISLDDLDAVVFDEVHYINNKERGKVWEETLILLPPEIRLILLSATLAAPEAFASWIGNLKPRPCVLIPTLYRVVPLTHYVIDSAGEMQCIMDAKDHYNDSAYKGWVRDLESNRHGADKFKEKVKAERAGGTEGAIGGKVVVHSFLHKLNSTINMYADKGLLPALFFVFSRKDCEKYACKVEATLIDSSDVASVKHIIAFHLHRYPTVQATKQYHDLYDLLCRGIAYHHSGLLPLLKEMVEILFGKGLIKVMFCTETFAVGINMPTKTATFLDLHKFDGVSGQRCLFTDEYLQMAGRAGRRGKDKVGTVVYLPQRKPAWPEEVKAMMKGSTRAIESRMDFHYDFLLKTLQSGELQWLKILQDSYWYKQRMETRDALIKERDVALAEASALRATITDAEYADLCLRVDLEAALKGSVNAAKKAAQGALDSWKNKHMGPRWATGWLALPAIKRLEELAVKKTADIAACENVSSTVGPRVAFLCDAGFLKDVDGSGVSGLSKDNLTLRGILATEVNESHSLLTAELYARGTMADMSGEIILTVLAAFINEKMSDTQPSLASLDIPRDVLTVLDVVDSIAADFNEKERRAGVPHDEYWTLCSSWIEPVWRWLQGESSAQLCADYEIYEGNLLRTVLRVANVADEWIALATYCEHSEMVSRMTEVKGRLIREFAISDSLYLRL